MKRYTDVLLLIFAFVLFGTQAVYADGMSSAIQASRVWKSIQNQAIETGVYRQAGYVFAYVVKKVDDPATLRVQELQAQREAGMLLFRESAREAASRVPQKDVPYLGFATGKLKVSGHVLLNDYDGHYVRYVFAVRQEDFDAAGAGQDVSLLAKQGRESLLSDPSPHVAALWKAGEKELALLSFLRSLPLGIANISPEPMSVRKSLPVLQKSWSLMDKAAGVVGEQKPVGKLAANALRCLESPSAFNRELKNEGVAAGRLGTPFAFGVTARVEACHGFVRMSGSMPRTEPPVMERVKKLFAEGRDLDLAIELLFSAAEQAPASPVVWEYLYAALSTAGRTEEAHTAARVWFLNASDVDREAMEALASSSSEEHMPLLVPLFRN